jgi:hypothetical protein
MDTPSVPSPPSAPTILLGWQATTVPVHQRTKRWYVTAGSLLLAGIAYGIITGAWSFSVVLVLCGALYFLLRNHVPDAKIIAFTPDGVLFDQQSLAYADIDGFWIIETPAYNQLHIRPKNRRKPDVVMQCGDTPTASVRSVLGQYCQEMKDKKETLVDILIRICKL